MSAGKTGLVALAVDEDVLLVAALKLLDGSLDVLHATLDTHLLAGEVAVQTGTVPVTRDGLGVDRDLGAKLLGDAVEKEAGHPEVVTHLNAGAGADLELPLSRHDLSVGARDLDAGVQAGLVVGLDDVTADNLASTNTAVVRTLRSRETALGPAVRLVVHVEESVLLLETEPGLVFGVGLHELSGLMAVVELVGGAIRHPALRENQDVGDTTEGVREDSDGAKVDVRVVTGRLLRGGAVEVPHGKVLGLEAALRDGSQSLRSGDESVQESLHRDDTTAVMI